MELYFIAHDVKIEKQMAVLLTKINAEAYKLIRDLCAPEKPASKTFAEIVKIMNNHLNPKPSETMERCKSYQAYQAATETVAEFTARLKSLSLNCNFAEPKTALRDQLVCGIKEHTTKIILFKEEKLTYEAAYKIAAALEAAEKNATSTDKANGEFSAKTEVNKVQGGGRERGRQRMTRERGATSGKIRGQRGEANAAARDTRGNRVNTRLAKQSACYCCGKTNHWARECRHRLSMCHTCKKKGHLAAVCRSREAEVRHVEEKTDKKGEEGAESDFFSMQTDAKGRTVENKSGNENTEPMYANIIVNRKKFRMEVDTGSYYTIMSQRDKETMFPGNEIKPMNSGLRAYRKIVLEHVGKIVLENLKVEYRGRAVRLRMVVMKGDGPILIGRQWLDVLGMWLMTWGTDNKMQGCNSIALGKMKGEFKNKYPKLFGRGPGLYNKSMLKLAIKENSSSVANSRRGICHSH